MFTRTEKMLYTLPAILFIAAMIAFPIFYTMRISLYDWEMSSTSPPIWVGLNNYAGLLTETRFWHSLWNTIYFSGIALILEVVLGIAIAMLLNRKMKYNNVIKALFLLPMVATPVAIALVWSLIYEPTIGMANYLLGSVGLDPLKWLASPKQAIPSLILIEVWEWTPMVSLIVLAGLTTLPAEPYEAAEVDGASAWQKFVSITLPLLKQTILVAILLRMVDVLKAFDIIYATTQGGPNYASETLTIYGYMISFQYFKLGLASSLIVIVFAIMLLLILPVLWLRKKAEVFE